MDNSWINLPEVKALPVMGITGEVQAALDASEGVVVSAPPGAGKSTALPLSLLGKVPPGQRVLMLEPRRIAARQIADRMSSLIGERVGETIGYRVRFESRVSSRTRLEVLTEGILSRMLVDDQMLDGVSMVIFDEFHERSLACDEAFALVRELQKTVRRDLRILIMSATIDCEAICRSTGWPSVRSGGRMFPVELIHMRAEDDPVESVVRAVRIAHSGREGDILAFLPGESEIRRCVERLAGTLGDTVVLPMYGMLPLEEQRRAIAPSRPGERKVVVATPIAETSLTIEGVRVVVDSGLCRKMVFDSQSALSRMETVRISLDMAVQRSGRAGRVAPGVCYRLWSEADEMKMPAVRIPEIEEADLAPLVLDVAAWGGAGIRNLQWLTPPPESKLRQAGQLLSSLGALTPDGKITPHGRELSSLPCHPRIAGMLLLGRHQALACDMAALLEERDRTPDAGADMTVRVNMLRQQASSGRPGRGWQRILDISGQYRRLLKAGQPDYTPADPCQTGMLIATAYPERIAKARPEGCGHFLLADGTPAAVALDDPLSGEEFLAVALVTTRPGAEGRIFLAAPVHPTDLPHLIKERDNVFWDSRTGSLIARHESNLGCHLIASRPITGLNRKEAVDIICRAAAKDGVSMLDFSDEVENLQRRVAFVSTHHPELDLPDISTDIVLRRAEEWLPDYIGNAFTVQELRKVDLVSALWGLLSYEQQATVEKAAPTHITVPSGSRIRLEYRQGAEAPVLRVRLQECFGLTDSPRVDYGRIPVLMELLSPGFKPVQLTSDLKSFWSGTYFEVRKELRRRYPKHAWPENPSEQKPVRGVPRKIEKEPVR